MFISEELYYCRYEREVNSAHRSALKRITEGDALAGTAMVLCIAALGVKDNNQPESPKKARQKTQTVDATIGQIELTDGW
jgi:breast cancer 2 susceptibility protein